MLQELEKVPGACISAALLPAVVIMLLFFSHTSVLSTMAQQPVLRPEKPLAYCGYALLKTRHITLQDLGKVPGAYIAAALLPAIVITLLFFFDHSVSSQMAQQPEFRLAKPSAYHYDFFLLGFMTIACGLIGVPPVNGVLPQVCRCQQNTMLRLPCDLLLQDLIHSHGDEALCKSPRVAWKYDKVPMDSSPTNGMLHFSRLGR